MIDIAAFKLKKKLSTFKIIQNWCAHKGGWIQRLKFPQKKNTVKKLFNCDLKTRLIFVNYWAALWGNDKKNKIHNLV